MTTKQYLAALKKLGLTPSGKATAQALGLTVRHCQRLAAGANIPEPIAKLLGALLALKHFTAKYEFPKLALNRLVDKLDT